MKKTLLLIALLFTALFCSAQQTTTTTTTISADSIMIGDQVVFGIEIDKDVSQEIGLPQFKDNKMTEKIEIVGTPTVDTLKVDGRRVKMRVNYIITSFEPGNYLLQGFPLVIADGKGGGDTLKTPTVNYLTVSTFEIDTAKQEVYDIKKPIDTPFSFDEVWSFIARHKWPFAAGALAAILIGTGIYFWLRHRAKRRAAPRADEPPHITAIRSLEVLRHKKLWQAAKVREYYSELSDILRVYIDGRYGVNAMEMVTPEILLALKDLCSERPFESAEQFFRLADLVKFAKWTPDTLQNEESIDMVYNFVEQTKIITTTPIETSQQ